MTLFDTHCHLDREEFRAEIDNVISDARMAGVSHFLIPGCGRFNWNTIEAMAQNYSGFYYALGLHPYFVQDHVDEDIAFLQAKLSAKKNKCVAVGECGLDFYNGRETEARQKHFFTAQIELAKKYNLPLILHCRKAHQDMISILKQHKPLAGGVIHGFTGSYQQAKDFVDLGFYIGVGGSITYERAQKTRKTIASLPLSCLVLETDAPDMPLSGYQGQPNRPERLSEIVKSLNVLRNEGKQTVASTLFVNSKRLFNICE